MSDCCIDCITLNVYMIRYQSRIISGNLMVSVENLASNESSAGKGKTSSDLSKFSGSSSMLRCWHDINFHYLEETGFHRVFAHLSLYFLSCFLNRKLKDFRRCYMKSVQVCYIHTIFLPVSGDVS
ncbi:unnamed protein product [Amaranthus hypochondriacus]